MNKRRFKIEKLKSLIGIVMVVVGLITDAGIGLHLYQHKAPQTAQVMSLDDKVRPSIVKLFSPIGTCSGEAIKAPSGKEYILSARHCSELALSDMMLASTEDGKWQPVHIVATSETSDLILLSPIQGMPILSLADQDAIHEKVHSFGHCHGRSTSRNDGELLEDILEPASALPDGMSPQNYPMGFTVSSAVACPGMSGGALVDDSGALVGVTSMGDGYLGYYVRLNEIRLFLSDK